MSDDEQQIRQLIDEWLRASAAGEIETVLGLMAEDVVFLIPGRPPMRGREEFAAMSRAMAGMVLIEGKPDIQEVQILGDYAYCWNYLTVTVTPIAGGPSVTQAGNVMSVFRKEPDGRWLLWRDANLLVRQPSA